MKGEGDIDRRRREGWQKIATFEVFLVAGHSMGRQINGPFLSIKNFIRRLAIIHFGGSRKGGKWADWLCKFSPSALFPFIIHCQNEWLCPILPLNGLPPSFSASFHQPIVLHPSSPIPLISFPILSFKKKKNVLFFK
jgi:hypothetical protein